MVFSFNVRNWLAAGGGGGDSGESGEIPGVVRLRPRSAGWRGGWAPVITRTSQTPHTSHLISYLTPHTSHLIPHFIARRKIYMVAFRRAFSEVRKVSVMRIRRRK